MARIVFRRLPRVIGLIAALALGSAPSASAQSSCATGLPREVGQWAGPFLVGGLAGGNPFPATREIVHLIVLPGFGAFDLTPRVLLVCYGGAGCFDPPDCGLNVLDQEFGRSYLWGSVMTRAA